MTLLLAVQRCPAKANAPSATSAAARSRSASDQTIAALLPPNSACNGTWRRPQMSWAEYPAATDPVMVTASTPGSAINASAVARSPHTRLRTPHGTPAFSKHSINLAAMEDPAGLGFQTIALPYARAGAILPNGIATGLFHGVIIA